MTIRNLVRRVQRMNKLEFDPFIKSTERKPSSQNSHACQPVQPFLLYRFPSMNTCGNTDIRRLILLRQRLLVRKAFLEMVRHLVCLLDEISDCSVCIVLGSF